MAKNLWNLSGNRVFQFPSLGLPPLARFLGQDWKITDLFRLLLVSATLLPPLPSDKIIGISLEGRWNISFGKTGTLFRLETHFWVNAHTSLNASQPT